MDPWTIGAWMTLAHLVGSAAAVALVSINRGESSTAPPCDGDMVPLELGTVPRVLPR